MVYRQLDTIDQSYCHSAILKTKRVDAEQILNYIFRSSCGNELTCSQLYNCIQIKEALSLQIDTSIIHIRIKIFCYALEVPKFTIT